MEKEHLHLLITEEIYRIPTDEIAETETTSAVVESSEKVITVAEPELTISTSAKPVEKEITKEEVVSEVKEPEPNIADETKDETPVEPQSAKEKKEVPHESPHIPIHDLPDSQPLPFAVFHTSHDPAENKLLHKIIDACKVPSEQYKIFSNGFDAAVKFKKALVFVPEAKAFYTPIPYKGSEFLCSKPLSDLSKDPSEKAKLWGALQKFVLN